MKNTYITCLIFMLTISLSGCAYFAGIQPLNQAQITNFETRSIDASFESVYSAATEALFDLGYIIRHSEKASGLIMGEKAPSERVWVPASQGKPGEYVDKQRVYSLTLLIRKDDVKSTNVRIKTSVNGEPKLNKQMVDQVWLYVDRQVMMGAEAPASVKVRHPKRKT